MLYTKGMPMASIINRMRMDQCSKEMIAEFTGEKLPGAGSDNSSSDEGSDDLLMLRPMYT